MKIMVVGSTGILGSALVAEAIRRPEFRQIVATYRSDRLKNSSPLIHHVENFDVHDIDRVQMVMSKYRPDVVVNCVVVKSSGYEGQADMRLLFANAVWPQHLSSICVKLNIRLIHISTDAVFSGGRGKYTECDIPDANDVYGISKLLGESIDASALIIRTSIVGHSMNGGPSLMDWLLRQDGRVDGWSRSYFSGLSSHELSRVICDIALTHFDLKGVYHISGPRISKFDLLKEIKHIYKLEQLNIHENDSRFQDRSLDGGAFSIRCGYEHPAWREMISELYSTFKSKG
jgi:dTDP-4-dehydrorhamnose reductase